MTAIAHLMNSHQEQLLTLMGGVPEAILIMEADPEDFDFDGNLNNGLCQRTIFMVSNFDFRQSLNSHGHSFSLVIEAPHFHFSFIPSFTHTRRPDEQDGLPITTSSTR